MIITLAFIVILLTILLAFFSWSTLQQQVSLASSNASSVDVLARGAVESVIGDLLQEIAAGSSVTNVVTGNVTTSLYYPATASNMVPSLSGFTTDAGLENILKVSSTSPVFTVTTAGGTSGTGPVRGIASASTNASYNGRSVSPLRWNRSLLIGRKDPTSSTDYTPVDAFTKAIPRWILIARNGSNPTTWSPDMRWSKTNGTTVIGRYAYIIYNEGGLLDANVAGYPPDLTSPEVNNPAYVPYKAGSYFADLTQIGLNKNQITALVGWRNNASAQATGTYPAYSIPEHGRSYAAAMVADTNGLNTCQTNPDPASSDRRFTSRQQLIEFLKSADPSGVANALNSLAYLGTFSRSLDQPTYFWDVDRPKIMAPGYKKVASGSSPAGDYVWGGNSAYGFDDLVNPAFSTIRVGAEFIRYDGTKAVVGEPLVKYRFPLSRLAWLTCKGPSALLSTSDPVIQQLLNNGVTPRTIDNGTAANILKCFGLTWNPGPGAGGIGGSWTYSHGIANAVGTLSDVAALAGANAREPDFFELLKAGLCAGSLAKGGQNTRNQSALNVAGNGYLDTGIDTHVLQIGANIMAQAGVDGFPTSILFDDGKFKPPIWGVNDLPYFQGLLDLKILVKKAIITPAPTIPTNRPPSPVTNGTLVDPGLLTQVFVPIIWNPHDGSSSVAVPGALQPSDLRICISSKNIAQFFFDTPTVSSPGYYYFGSSAVNNTAANFTAPWNVGNYDSTKGLFLTMPGSGEAGNTAMTYHFAPNLYREPTVLMQPNVPAGSSLALDSNNAMALSAPTGSDWSAGIPELNSGQRFVGFYAGSVPGSWQVTAGGTTTIYTTSRIMGVGGCPTISMEYRVGNTWIPYQQVSVNNGFTETNANVAPSDAIGGTTNPFLMMALDPKKWSGGTMLGVYASCISYPWDPRSRRWQTAAVRNYGPLLSAMDNTIVSQRPGAAVGTLNYGSTFMEMGADNKVGYFNVTGSTWDYFKAGASTGNYFFVDPNGYSVDADGVKRLGMAAAYNSAVPTTNGLPLAIPSAPSSRPILLHRPYRNVGELGYVFSDTPWRNLDFATPQSGCSALLDIFCIQENVNPDALVVGKVDLNTRQAPVMRALIEGGCRDELSQQKGTDSPLSAGEADSLATKLVARTSGTAPLRNIGDLVGRWISGSASASQGTYNGPTTSQPIYDGFSADLASYYTNSSTTVNNRVQRFRDAPIRALAHSGQVGAWDLLIDIVVQTGKFPASVTTADQFQVQGETRYWVHLAIDRLTGRVLDKNIERVNE